jgi:hypothetical protein
VKTTRGGENERGRWSYFGRVSEGKKHARNLDDVDKRHDEASCFGVEDSVEKVI